MKGAIKKGLFGKRFYYIDEETRVKWRKALFRGKGWGIYELQRKGHVFWRTVSHVYVKYDYNFSLPVIISHLKSKELKCVF